MSLNGVDCKENDAQDRFKLYCWLLEQMEQYKPPRLKKVLTLSKKYSSVG